MNPRQFLNALLETIICIQITVNTQTQAGLQQRQKMLDRYEQTYNVSFGADDMLPIFIYVLIHAQLKNAATACAVMEFCCDRSTLNDEYGYYLTCFQSAVDFVVRKSEEWANKIRQGQQETAEQDKGETAAAPEE